MTLLYSIFILFFCAHTTLGAQEYLTTLTTCEDLTGWGNSASLTSDAKEGDRAISAPMPTNNTGFLTFNYQNTGHDISSKYALSFWWKVEGTGLQDLKIKIRNYPLVNGMEAVYTIWSGQNAPQGWQLATVELAKPQYDTWGGEPDQNRRYITFRTEVSQNANITLFVDQIVAADKTFEYQLSTPVPVQTDNRCDLDGDGIVGFSDFIQFAQRFTLRASDAGFEPRFDFNTDNVINFSDFIFFVQSYGSDGTAWQIPITLTVFTSDSLRLAIGHENTSLLTTYFSPGQQTIDFDVPYHLTKERDPSNTFAIPLWMQIANTIQTRQTAVSYLPQTGQSRTFEQFISAKNAGTEPILPDFSYSGYHYFSKPVPNVTDSIFNVTDYGAIPNDLVSDQLAIQRAIDDAERNGRGIVFFPPGEFLVNTGTDHNTPITIRESNIILRGSGSREGGTIIRQVNYMPPTNPEQLWTSPYMFQFTPINTSDRLLCRVTNDAGRETFWLTVDDASDLKVGQWVTLYMNSVSAISDFLSPYQTEPNWSTMRTNGIQIREKHSIAEIDGNHIRLREPLHADVKAKYGYTIREYQHIEEVGIEDISFHGTWLDEFVHHKDAIHDGGWSLVEMNRCVNAWVRRVSFVHCNRALHVGSSTAVSIYHVTQAGNKGHSSIASNGGYGVWVGLSEDLAAHHHGPGTSSRSVGTVYWRYTMQRNQRIDAHGAQPYASLLDCVEGGILYGSGASIENFPNHLKHYVLWNFYHSGNESHYDFWRSGDARDRFVKPIVVGLHGEPVTFNEQSLQILESHGSKVEPESLFEAQLQHRLQTLPAWLEDLRSEWEQIRNTPLPSFPATTF